VSGKLRESSEHGGIIEEEKEERWSAENAGGAKKRTRQSVDLSVAKSGMS
jgi:hypothetical protein